MLLTNHLTEILKLNLCRIRDFLNYIKHIHRYHEDINKEQYFQKLVISSIINDF